MFDLVKTKRYGLALGAGGFKGFVHVGVIKALEELDIEITHIGGSSIGAIVGGMYALTKDIKKVEDFLLGYDKRKLANLFRKDIGLKNGLFKGDEIIDELHNFFGDSKIEDCLIPFVVVTVDVLSGEKIYYTSGTLKNILRASCSIPLVFEPYELNGRYLVDGGMAENVPVDAVKSIGARKTIGVNIQGFPMRNEKLNLKTLTLRSYRASMYHLARRDIALADVKLSFELEDYDAMELVENPEELINMGYEKTIKEVR